MCGRFTLAVEPADLQAHFQLDSPPVGLQAHYNIAPSQQVAVVRGVPGLGRRLDHVRWGLIPCWADDWRIGNRLINARAETASTKPAFRAAFHHRRCLIPADGFYEWKRTGGKQKQPYWVGMADGGLFAFAGLWEHWEEAGTGRLIESCTLLTTSANDLVSRLHDRMPVIIDPSDYFLWLSAGEQAMDRLQRLFVPYTAKEMIAKPVSRDVNSPLKDNPSLVEAVEPESE